jgi:hypothetical protein
VWPTLSDSPSTVSCTLMLYMPGTAFSSIGSEKGKFLVRPALIWKSPERTVASPTGVSIVTVKKTCFLAAMGPLLGIVTEI